MAGTNTKKELIDFLWEWAEPNGDWGKLLIANIIAKQGELSEEERSTIFNYYLGQIGFVFKIPLVPLAIVKPTFSIATKEIVLKCVRNIKGVNLLDEEQQLEFSSGITVIYGNNGVGKTGYSRILKSLGYSFDNTKEILSNVNEGQKGQSCTIDYEIEGNADSHDWNGTETIEDLSAISVFNSDCVNISLGSGRELLVAPQGFYMFQLVKNELAKLEQLHTAQILKYPITLPWKEQLHPGTPQWKFIDELSTESDEQELEDLADFKPSDKHVLAQKAQQAKGLNKGLLQNRNGNLNLYIRDLDRIIAIIKKNETNLTASDLANFLSYNEQLAVLHSRTQLNLSGIAEQNGLEMYNTPEFTNFLKSADTYIKILNKENYPNNSDDNCVYCKQSLENINARNLVNSYKELLNDTTQAEINRITKLKGTVNQRAALVDGTVVLYQPVYGQNEEGEINQPAALTELNSKTVQLKEHLEKGTLTKEMPFDLPYRKCILFLEKKKGELEKERDTVAGQLQNLLATERGIQNDIAELMDRELLSKKKEAIKQCISNMRAQNLLNDNSHSFNSTSLSVKTTKARDELIAQDFNAKFEAELLKFRKSHLGVKISFYTSKGSSRISQNISTFNINQVLSEGEQKAIALAEFLTEMQMDDTIAPVVFDDPVNSLDHHIIDDVARRLVELSSTRQVVVFTHSILLYNSLFAMKKNVVGQSIDFKFYNVYRNIDKAGLLADGFEINKVSVYIKKINNLLNSGLQGRSENEVAEEGYGHLRAALELFVTDIVFQNTVKRYRKNIMMTKFPDVNGELIDKHKATIDELFGRASKFITGHSDPQIIHSPPSLSDLRPDFVTFLAIKKEFPI